MLDPAWMIVLAACLQVPPPGGDQPNPAEALRAERLEVRRAETRRLEDLADRLAGEGVLFGQPVFGIVLNPNKSHAVRDQRHCKRSGSQHPDRCRVAPGIPAFQQPLHGHPRGRFFRIIGLRRRFP